MTEAVEMQEVQELQATVERLSLMASSLEETMAGLERRISGLPVGMNSGEVDRMLATVESATVAQVEALETRLVETERQLAMLQAAAAEPVAQQGRRTLAASAASLLAKHGVGEAGPVEASAIDAALVSLPVEQRIAVKSQLMRAGILG
jgi:chromosome segregation ATPase